MFNVIDFDKDDEYFKYKIQLCKPNKRVVANISELTDLRMTVSLSDIYELSFNVPYLIQRNHSLIENPLIEKLKLGYFVKVNFKNKNEYFVITNDSKSLNNDGESISYNLRSIAYKLSNYDVYEYKTVAKNLSQTVGELLETTGSTWSLGFVNADFDLIFRSVDIQTSNVLESIIEIAKTFAAVPLFDTDNKVVNFQLIDSTGINRGLKAKEGTFLESYNIDTTLDEIVTRLKCYGKEGLEFRTLTPNGSNFIQDFSYFLYPFEYDSEYNVTRSSNYMSDELAIALVRFSDLIEARTPRFNALVIDRTSKINTRVGHEQNLANLNTERKTIENELDVINLTYGESARNRSEWINVNARLDNVIGRINAQELQITNLNSELDAIDLELRDLSELLAEQNNFTNEQLNELSEYIFVKEFSDENIITEEDLLKAGQEVFSKYREPKVTLKFSLAQFMNDINFGASRKKINLGDIVTFESKKFKTKFRTRIVEIQYDLSEGNIDITTSNDLEKVDDEELIIDLLSYTNATSKNLQKNLYKLDLAQTANTEINRLINGAFDTARTILLGGIENTNEMTERGFYSRDYFNPQQTFLVINGGQMAITNDGGRSVEVAISKDGVVARRLVGSVILGNRLQIESESGVVSIFDNQINIKDNTGLDRVQLGRYQDPNNTSLFKYGLKVLDGAIDIRTTDNANRGMQMDSRGLRAYNNNGARTFEINAVTGDLYFVGNIESSTITGSTIQTNAQALRGIKLTPSGLYGYSSNGNLSVYLDVNSGQLNIQDGNFSGGITASTITGGDIYGTTITGGTISGTVINGSTIRSTGSNGDIRIDGGSFSSVYGGSTVTINNGFVRSTSSNGEYASLNSGEITVANGSFSRFARLGYDYFEVSSSATFNFQGGFNFTESPTGIGFARTAGSLTSIDTNQILRTETNGLEITQNTSAPDRLAVKINGSFIGDIQLA